MTLSALWRTMRADFTFALPFIAGQVGLMLFGVCDTFVAGHHSQEALAALGTAHGLGAPIFMLGIGIMNAIAPLAAYDKGRGNQDHVYFLPAVASALVCGLAAWPLIILALKFIPLFNLNPAITPMIVEYQIWVTPSVVFMYLFQAGKEYLQARGHTIFANATVVAMNVLNVGLNIVFMFGAGPIPEMGVKGLAIATLITRFGLAALVLGYAWKVLAPDWRDKGQREWKRMREIFALGLPLGIGILAEVLVFCTVTILIGSMETIYAAAHNLVLTMASLTFMVPLALSSVAAVKVAHARGAGDWEGVRLHASACGLLSVIVMGTSALVYFTMPQFLVGLATTDQALIQVSSMLLIYVGIFQIPDGLQVTFWGSLRGINVAKAPLYICLVCHWLIGLPLGHYLAFNQGMKAQGLWIGLTVGLVFLALGLGLLWPRAVRRQAPSPSLNLQQV